VKTDPVEALAAGRGLDEQQALRLRQMLEEIERDEHAPTAVREASQAADKHLADSLAGLEVPQVREASSVADLGSGAGFPGLALAVALPRARFSLIESRRRSCEFLERIISAAGIENAQVSCVRAEEWREGLSHNDVIVARALAAQPVVLEYAAPLLRTGGRLVDWRGRRDEAQERASTAAAELLGLRLLEIRRVEPFAGATDRHLHVFVKDRETPERFPRRAGIARKRPLGG
jgi:16S rRNA (guanine527-N7)-methyltransferase